MIIKNLTTPAGAATTVHVITQIQIRAPGDFARVEVRSYANEQAYATDAGNLGNQVMTVPLQGSIMAMIEEWLTSSTESPFVGGSFATDPNDSLDALRARKTTEINTAWIKADSTAFTYAGEHFRAGADDVLRLNSINGYISLMNEMPPDWIGVWKTMGVGGQPDSYIELPDVASWKPFFTAFVMKGVNNYLTAQVLKAQLADAETADEITVIHWPE